MPYRKKNFDQNAHYHIFNRGVNKEIIFYSDNNYEYCLNLIRKQAKIHSISIVAYCFMPNHYHLLIRQNGSSTISRFIQGVFRAYVLGLNKQINRTGPLFEGRFRHIKISQQGYLLHLCRYIHMNPVKAGLVVSPEQWLFSNYLDWIGKRKRGLVDSAFVKTYFNTGEKYTTFVLDYKQAREYQERLQKYTLE